MLDSTNNPIDAAPADRKVAGKMVVGPVEDIDILRPLMSDHEWRDSLDDGTSIARSLETLLMLGPGISETTRIFLLVGWAEGEPVGVVTCYPRTSVSYDAHIMVLEKFRKSGLGVELCKKSIQWMLDNVKTAKKVVIHVAEDNLGALALVKKCGFREEGRTTKSFMRNGVLLDEIIFGMTDQEFNDV